MSAPSSSHSKMPLAVVLSFGVHALALLLLLIGGRFTWPAPPIPIEVVPSHRAPSSKPPTSAAPPSPSPSTERPTPGAHAHAPRTKPAAQEKPQPPPATSDLKPFAPDDANLVVLLRSDKLRKSPHRAATEALLSALPDYSTLLAGTGLSPIDDFEALLIATADPHDMTATFLAARYRDETRVRNLGGRPLQPGDPRVFRFPRPGLAVLTRPDDAARLDGAPLDGGALAPCAERRVGCDDPRTHWLRQLEQFDKIAATDGGPAVLVTLSDVPALLRFGDQLPTPQTLALAATADASPALHLKAVFRTVDEAHAMEAAWPDILKRYRSVTALLGLSTALDGLKLERHEATLELEGRVAEAQMRLALSWSRALLPPPPGVVDGGAPLR